MGGTVEVTDSLQALQSKQQQQVLDTVDQLRKCGLESILSLPQLVVCGDQSAGKSSVLEALTEIPFPRKDNLCTRFATEIILRRAHTDVATVKIVPDKDRDAFEQAAIKKFGASLISFEKLPDLIDKATEVMGIGDGAETFSNDLLSIEIAGPNRPQLTVVDLPGLIQNGEPNDIKLVHDLTERYISSPRTICLAVISATHDHANQGILNMIRGYDKQGDRTLGIITKPDRLEKDSGSEKSYMSLARNEEFFLKLGWHVLKNRSFSDGDTTFLQRNANEALFFKSSNWKTLPKEYTGIDELRKRLSHLLFNHVKGELPKLRDDLEEALTDVRANLANLGPNRSSAEACKSFLLDRSNEFSNACRAAVGGHYDGTYFLVNDKADFDPVQLPSLRRLRAAVQELNANFSSKMLRGGQRYKILPDINSGDGTADLDCDGEVLEDLSALFGDKDAHKEDQSMTHEQALDWIKQAMRRNRGKELAGNFNLLLIGELFKIQSSPWENRVSDHILLLDDVCSSFLEDLLGHYCPEDVRVRLWPRIEEQLRARKTAALDELLKLAEDLQMHPINYNHYYTDTVQKRRRERQAKSSLSLAHNAIRRSQMGYSDTEALKLTLDTDLKDIERDMERHSCEEILDCVSAIYKVCPGLA
jgi:GTP-binding protein EngB required for normal cell division